MGDSGMSEEPKQEDRGAQENQQQGVRSLLIGVAIAGAILLVIGLWAFVGPSTTTEKKDFVQAVGVLLAGLVGLMSLLLTWRNQRLTQRSLEDTRRNTQEQLRLTEQGQITERFTRAIDQLGATDDKGEKKLEIRLGGIYALERIDKESPERAYHPTVMEVLTAYVRENSPREQEEPSTASTASNEGVEQDKGVTREQDARATQRRLPTDIQAILDVLSRREEERAPKEHRALLDLREAHLQRAHCTGADLQRADLTGADLQRADLRGANLMTAYLWEADLREAYLMGANLMGAHCTGADVQSADLTKAYLTTAEDPELRDFLPKHLGGPRQNATLIRADLRGAVLREAYLWEAYLWEADLRGADLRGADLRGADLQGANLRGANLQEANLREAEVTDEQLADTRSLKGATMPDGSKHT